MEISEIQLSFKPRIKAKERITVRCSKDAFRAFLFKWDEGLINYQEEFKVMLLNNANHVLGILVHNPEHMHPESSGLSNIFAG